MLPLFVNSGLTMATEEEEHVIDLYDLHHYVASVRSGHGVGDVIKNFQASCGGEYCEGCGAADVSAGKCKGCHIASYCSIDCQKRDWKEGGHAVECEAIKNGDSMACHTEAVPLSIVAARHLARCSALACAKMACAQDGDALEVPTAEEIAHVDKHVGHFIAGLQLEPVGEHWMQGAVKHPGAFKAMTNRADHGKWKGKVSAFAHHVLDDSKHHYSGLARKRASLALTFARFRHHGHRGGHHRGGGHRGGSHGGRHGRK